MSGSEPIMLQTGPARASRRVSGGVIPREVYHLVPTRMLRRISVLRIIGWCGRGGAGCGIWRGRRLVLRVCDPRAAGLVAFRGGDAGLWAEARLIHYWP